MQAEQTDGRQPMRWSDVDWAATEAAVRRIQDRIFRAAKAGDGAKVKNLQKLLVRSRSAKMLAIRQVTQQNAGRNTPGIDGVVCKTPKDRVTLLESGLELKGYKPKPVRRVSIPKANGKLRPLGIPTVKDRVMQAVVKLALEPEWEPRFEANSYGFRPGRCTMDAIEAIFMALGKKGSSRWILDADISGCFDNIAHGPLLAKLPTFTRTIEGWLKAGSIELGDWRESGAGTPQGGIASPLLANIALDGLERLFEATTKTGKPIKPSRKKGSNRGVILIRYADDFVAVAPSKEALEEYVIPKVEAFLAERGLSLSQEKTRVTTIGDGFSFLGFEARKFRDGKLLIRPDKAKVLAHLRAIKTYLDANKQTPVGDVVHELLRSSGGGAPTTATPARPRPSATLTTGSGGCCGNGPSGGTRRRARRGLRPATFGGPRPGDGTSRMRWCRGHSCFPGTTTPRSPAIRRSRERQVPLIQTHGPIGKRDGGKDWKRAPTPSGGRASSRNRAMPVPHAVSRSIRTKTLT